MAPKLVSRGLWNTAPSMFFDPGPSKLHPRGSSSPVLWSFLELHRLRGLELSFPDDFEASVIELPRPRGPKVTSSRLIEASFLDLFSAQAPRNCFLEAPRP